MKITLIKEKPTKVIKVVRADCLNDFVLRVSFSDGSDQVVDFKHFLSKSFHPSVNKYYDEKKFKKFKILDGNINWNDYEMIFPIDDLYNGKIS
jgi:hypothetical protein